MKKRKTIKRLEALIDALEQSKEVIAHNIIETDIVNDMIIDYQTEYKTISGHYYDIKHKHD